MYFAIDGAGAEFEAPTLQALMKELEAEGNYFGDNPASAVENKEISVFKGTRVKIKCIPARYEEIVEKKPVAAKKPQVKAKR